MSDNEQKSITLVGALHQADGTTIGAWVSDLTGSPDNDPIVSMRESNFRMSELVATVELLKRQAAIKLNLNS